MDNLNGKWVMHDQAVAMVIEVDSGVASVVYFSSWGNERGSAKVAESALKLATYADIPECLRPMLDQARQLGYLPTVSQPTA